MMKVSVITVTYNDAENLERTLAGLLKQDYKEIESIIIDGGSSDNSVEIIKQFEKKFKGTVKWISEKDNGLYDAANKGIMLADGDIIGCYWDIYTSSKVISKIVKRIETDNTDGVHSDLVFLEGKKVVRYWKMGQGKIQHGWLPAHPTLYLKKKVYEKYGLYNPKYRCAGDYEFMIRILKHGDVTLSYIPDILITMFYGGVSTNGFHAYKQSMQEGIRALKENKVPFPWFVTLLRIMRTSVQFIHKIK